jgi:hypothetical protein
MQTVNLIRKKGFKGDCYLVESVTNRIDPKPGEFLSEDQVDELIHKSQHMPTLGLRVNIKGTK